MVHRGFGEASRPSKNRSVLKAICDQNTPTRSYFEDMALLNGARELTEEQLSEAQLRRDQFRDDVSRRMGELLLRGMTMLDDYCQVCNGILMENRNRVRNCVTCELFDELTKEGSRLVADVPLDLTADGVSPGNGLLVSEHLHQRQNSVNVIGVEGKQRAEGSTGDHEESSVKSIESIRNTQDANGIMSGRLGYVETAAHSFDGYTTVFLAVDRKLKWASEQLDSIENPSEIREMFALINEGINIIRCLKLGSQ